MRIEQLHELFDLNESDGQLRWAVSRGTAKAGKAAGNRRKDGRLQVMVGGRHLLVHRVIFAMANGYWPDEVDHRDGDPTNNRPENLRAATSAENNCNARTRSDNASGVKGVGWHKRHRKWHAQGQVGGRKHHLGYFSDIDAAEAAVRAFRELHHGEFARHA